MKALTKLGFPRDTTSFPEQEGVGGTVGPPVVVVVVVLVVLVGRVAHTAFFVDKQLKQPSGLRVLPKQAEAQLGLKQAAQPALTPDRTRHTSKPVVAPLKAQDRTLFPNSTVGNLFCSSNVHTVGCTGPAVVVVVVTMAPPAHGSRFAERHATH